MGEALDRAVGDAPGRVIIATFASLISRIQQVITAAENHGRHVAFVGRSMVANVQMATEMGYLDALPDTIIPVRDVASLPPESVVLMTTGSQGEPTSALVRIANGGKPGRGSHGRRHRGHFGDALFPATSGR